LELGGLAGGLFSAYLSDKLNGHRIWVVAGYCACLAAAIAGFYLAPSGNAFLISCSVALCGFFIYGPQVLVGLIGAELSHPRAVATSNGLLGWISYTGAACAGEPLAFVVKAFGWGWFYSILAGCTFLPILLLIPFWNVRRYEELNLGKKAA